MGNKYIEQYKNQIFVMLFCILLWPNIIISKSLEFLVLTAFVLVLLFHNGIKIDNIVKHVILFVFVGIISWARAIFTEQTSYERIAAAIILVMVWLIAMVIYDLARRSEIALEKIAQIFFYNYMIWIASAVLFLILKRTDMTGGLYYMEYGRARFVGWFEYATLNVPFAITHASLASYFVWKKTKSRVLTLGCYLLQWLPLYYTYSRSGYVLIVLQMICFIGYFLLRELKERGIIKKGVSLFLTFAVPLVPIVIYVAMKILNILMGLREGSNSSRTIIYTETLEKILEHPIIGNGIKEFTSIGYPLGSHCTYLGFLYRTGIIGTVIIVSALVIVIVNIWKNRKLYNTMWFSLFMNVLLLLAFAVFEDLDGEYWLLCMLFFTIGLLKNKSMFLFDKGR